MQSSKHGGRTEKQRLCASGHPAVVELSGHRLPTHSPRKKPSSLLFTFVYPVFPYSAIPTVRAWSPLRHQRGHAHGALCGAFAFGRSRGLNASQGRGRGYVQLDNRHHTNQSSRLASAHHKHSASLLNTVPVAVAAKAQGQMNQASHIDIDMHGRPCLDRGPEHLGLRDVTLPIFSMLKHIRGSLSEATEPKSQVAGMSKPTSALQPRLGQLAV